MKDIIKNYFDAAFITITHFDNVSLSNAVTFVNLQRVRIIAVTVIFIMGGMIFFDYALLGATHIENALLMRPWLIFMRLVFILASLVFLATINIPDHPEKLSRRHSRHLLRYLFFNIICICIFTSMVQAIRDEISAYLLVIFYLASFVYLDRRQSSFLFVSSLLFMGLGTWFIQIDKGIFVYNMLNAGIMTLLAWIASQILYANQKREYHNQQLINKQTAQLAESNEQLERLSYMDPLTNLPNRRYFDEFIEQKWSKAQINCQPIALILADIDNFKELNDNFGHQIGDMYLKQVGLVLCSILTNPEAVVARLGGDEFAVVIPDTDGESARSVANQMLYAVQALNKYHNNPLGTKISISLGVASLCPSEEHFIKEFFYQADQALYEAKRLGRNQVAY